MRWILAALLLAAGWYYYDLKHQVPYSAGQRSYKITLGEHPSATLRADRIERKDGCVLFYRQDRIDTLLCEGMAGQLTVTEVYE